MACKCRRRLLEGFGFTPYNVFAIPSAPPTSVHATDHGDRDVGSSLVVTLNALCLMMKGRMNALVIPYPLTLALGIRPLIVFMRTLKSNQYEDLDGAAWRIIENDNVRTT